MFPYVVHIVRLIQGCHFPGGLVKPGNRCGQGIPEKSGYTAGHIDTGPFQLGQGNYFDPHHPMTSCLPHRFQPHEVQELSDTGTMISKVAGGPEDDAATFGIMAFIGDEFLYDIIGHLLSDFPGRLRRKGTGVDAVKIPPRRQEIGTAGSGRTGGGWVHELSIQCPEEVSHFQCRLFQVRRYVSADIPRCLQDLLFFFFRRINLSP